MENRPRDRFEEYFTEKLWNMIPAVYRSEDAQGPTPGVLRALVKIVAEQAAVLRRSHDRLWEDEFIETCSDWVVPYIGDLVGTRMVAALNTRRRRVDVAKTVYYRRRAGTLRVLEELIADITGWEGRVVEQFRRLGRTRHGLDPKPLPQAGRWTGTVPGGWADLRRQQGVELVGGPFDELHRTADVRRHNGALGRYNIPKLAFHLYRLGSFAVSGVTPMRIDDRRYTFDPSGRDVPLFIPRGRPSGYAWDRWRPAEEWELPGPLRCRLLARETAALWPNALRVAVAPEGENSQLITANQVAAGCLADWSAQPVDDKTLVVDPRLGRLLFLETPPSGAVKAGYHYGFSGEVGAGTYDRIQVEDAIPSRRYKLGQDLPSGEIGSGISQIEDSATYLLAGSVTTIVESAEIRAANQQRPYLRVASDWVMQTAPNADAAFSLDGLWIGAAWDQALVLEGDFERVTIRHVTIDPGGIGADGRAVPAVPLVVRGNVEELRIESSILGPVRTEGGNVEKLVVRDSIVQSLDPAVPAMCIETGDTVLERVTVFGSIVSHRLWATDSIITGLGTVTDTQSGCFRFSAARGGRLPRPYEHSFSPRLETFFASRRFGDPGFAQLRASAPPELGRGAENGSEMGAFCRLLNPIKLDSLRAKVEEFAPIGLIPVFVNQT